MELTISPEGLELANAYLEAGGDVRKAAEVIQVSESKAVDLINKAEVKRYIDQVYLDLGYRNRFKIAEVLDEMIDSKLEEARESELYSSKDLMEIMKLAHQIRMDEAKLSQQAQETHIKNQTNVQINDNSTFGSGNYGKLMDKLLSQND